jgi:hypothetical protein
MSSALIFGIAVIVAVGVVATRRFRAQTQVRHWFAKTGHDPQKPHVIQNPAQILELRLQDRCHCGATLHHLGDETRSSAQGSQVVVTCECVDCDELRVLYFDLSQVPH